MLRRGLAMRIVAAAAAAVTAAPTLGEGPSTLYAGAGLAVVDFTSDHDGVGYGATPLGWQLYGGWQVRERAGVELAFDRLSSIDSGNILGSGVERLRIAADYSTVTVRGVFSLSLEEVLRRRQKITLFGTLGVAHSTEQRSVLELNTARQTTGSDRDNNLVLGVGAMFDLPRLRLRTYLQSVDRAEGGLNSVGAAAEFRF